MPAPIAEEKPKLEIPSKPAPATVPAEENKALPQAPAPVAKENKLPETGSQGSEWLIATGLMAALTAYGLSKKKRLILFENRIQTTSASPCRICVTDFVSSIHNLKTVF